MLTLKSLVTFASMAVFSASAAPAMAGEADVIVAEPVAARDLETRQSGSGCVKLCGDHYFGWCQTFCTGHNQCATLSGLYDDWISSLEVVDWPQWTCTYYEHPSCTGASFTPHYEDTLHDSSGPTGWADRISSVKCFNRCDGPFSGC